MDHEYLARVIRKIGLLDRFVKAVEALYRNAKTLPIVNGYKGEPFYVRSGVRQGDPLSCILYNIAIEPFARFLEKSDFRGIQLPDRSRLKVVQFADDTCPFARCNNDFIVL